MRILFVTPYVPSPLRIRPYAFIRELAERGHQVTLVCLIQPTWEAQYLPDVTRYCQAVYPVFLNQFEPLARTMLSLPTRVPLSVAYCRSSQLDLLLHYLDAQGNFDAIHTEFMRAAPATHQLNGKLKVYDIVDSLALAYRRSLSASHVSLQQRAIALVEWLKVRQYEPSMLKHFDRLLVSSPADQKSLGPAGQSATVIPNGVQLDYFSYDDRPRPPETIMFLGKMSYYVNVSSVLWFYRKVLPLIRQVRPKVKFQIVGRNPTQKIKNLAADPFVEVTGTVPDVRAYLSNATVSVVPMVSGAGIQNKMLESMAVGTPCVATSLATQALCAEPTQDYLVANDPQDFASAVLELIDNPTFHQSVSVQGRKYVEFHHDWARIGEQLNAVYQ